MLPLLCALIFWIILGIAFKCDIILWTFFYLILRSYLPVYTVYYTQYCILYTVYYFWNGYRILSTSYSPLIGQYTFQRPPLIRCYNRKKIHQKSVFHFFLNMFSMSWVAIWKFFPWLSKRFAEQICRFYEARKTVLNKKKLQNPSVHGNPILVS